MVGFALNHMTVARSGFSDMLDIAAALDCVGVELRNDLSGPIFDGRAPARAADMLRDRGLRLLALAELKAFNAWTSDSRKQAEDLIAVARASGAEAISLIPRNDKAGMGNGERQANLRLALRELRPMLEDAGLIGLVEPLGFMSSSLRFKREAVDAIDAVGGTGRFRIVHDTFHHHLAGEAEMFPEFTGIVHVSGVADASLAISEMQDRHRVLVDKSDRLGNVEQLRTLRRSDYDGPVSFECFAPEIHELTDPRAELARSFAFIGSALTVQAA